MKELRWKIFWCLFPIFIGLLLIGTAWYNYTSGSPLRIAGHEMGRIKFKLGVDLVGGTILVYEIDPDKKPENYDKDQLIAALKRRLDPADLYNITIRPLSDTRVEIILPTGGKRQLEAQKEAWDTLLAAARKQWPTLEGKDLTARRGDTAELSEQIRQYDSTIKDQEVETLVKEHYSTDRALTGDDVERFKDLIQRVGSLEFRVLANRNDDREAIEATKKEFDASATSWKEFLTQVKAQYPDIDTAKKTDKKEGDEKEPAAASDETSASISCGDLRGLADLVKKRYADGDKGKERDIDRWLADNFRPNPQLNELNKRAERGLPPPPPQGAGGKFFNIDLNDGKHRSSYSWVELGKDELHTLGLNNASKDDPEKGGSWRIAAAARAEGKLVEGLGGRLGAFSEGTRDFRVPLYSRKIPNPSRLSPKDRDKKYEYFLLTRDPEQGKEVTGEYLSSASVGSHRGTDLAVNFKFTAKGEARFYDLTNANSPPPNDRESRRFLAIVLDGQIMSAPGVESAIRGEGIIHGRFTKADVEGLVNILRSGALPATLKPQPVSENTMGATLGDDTIEKGTLAIGIAFAAVLTFMLLYYRFAGMVACIALVANLVLTVAFMIAVNATFTLPGLAGIVLTLGMAVDANVLIYERLREERERGAGLSLALRNGYDRALPTIIDTHLTSILTAIVLYVVGNDQLKGFGISLTVGLLISLFTALYMTRVMFTFWEKGGMLKELSMAKLMSKPNIDFMSMRKPVFLSTVCFALFGVGIFLMRGTSSLNMDFVGGTIYSGVLSEPRTIDELRKSLDDDRQRELLALDKDPEYDSAKDVWRLTYKTGDDRVREIRMTEKTTPPELRRRVEELPEVSLELIFSKEGEVSGKGSKQFTVRTTEKSAEIVAASISRLLGDNLEKPELKGYTLGQVSLFFTNALTPDQADDVVMPLLINNKLIPNRTKDQIERRTALKALPLGGVAGSVLAGRVGFGNEATLTGNEAGVQVNTYKSFQLSFKSPQSGKKLLESLRPLYTAAEGKEKTADVQVSSAQISLTRYVFLAQVKTLMDKEFKGVVSQEVNLTEADRKDEEDGRYDRMNLGLPGLVTADQFVKSMDGFGVELKNRPLPIRLENFDSQLAKDMQQRALYAIIASWGAMLLFLWFRFGNWTFGLAAVLCLIHDVCFTLGIIAFAHYVHGTFISDALALRDFKIDLPAVAALLTLIGFSVNDTIVVFDRIREVRGKNPALTPATITDSINQTLSRTILTSMTVWLVVIVLYIWGGEGVHLFAFVMVVGVIVGTYSSIFVASPLLLILGEGSARRQMPGRPERETVGAGREEGEDEEE